MNWIQISPQIENSGNLNYKNSLFLNRTLSFKLGIRKRLQVEWGIGFEVEWKLAVSSN